MPNVPHPHHLITASEGGIVFIIQMSKRKLMEWLQFPQLEIGRWLTFPRSDSQSLRFAG